MVCRQSRESDDARNGQFDCSPSACTAAGGLQRILRISASLVGTQAATSVLGLLFWTLASRNFAKDQFGVANAAISAMGLLGALGTLGLGTLLISLLPQTPQGVRRVTVRTALAVSAARGPFSRRWSCPSSRSTSWTSGT